MKLNRLVVITVCLTVTACTALREPDEEEEPKEKSGLFPVLHQNHPRIFGIFSKPPEKEAPKQTGPGIMGHLGNVLQGGSIGIELSARPIGTLLDQAKKLIPGRGGGQHGTVGQPNHEKPPHDKPNPDWEMKEPEKEKPMKEPMKEPEPDRDGYDWDDIGEHELSTEVPIEDLIDPRRTRPKRFIESKIYHVPLTFRSNGKPFKVMEKTRNSVETKDKL